MDVESMGGVDSFIESSQIHSNVNSIWGILKR